MNNQRNQAGRRRRLPSLKSQSLAGIPWGYWLIQRRQVRKGKADRARNIEKVNRRVVSLVFGLEIVVTKSNQGKAMMAV